MTNWGFISGCTILAFGIFFGAFYINRAILAGASWIADALKDIANVFKRDVKEKEYKYGSP